MLSIEVIKDKYGVEQAALVQICRVFVGSSSADELNNFFEQHVIDFPALYNIIVKNKIRPIAHYVLQFTNIAGGIRQQLKQDRQKLAIHTAQQQAELIMLLEFFKQRDIVAVPYKGLAFATAFYKDPTLREFVDIDLLVEPFSAQQLLNTIDAFTSLGYKPMYDLSPGIMDIVMNNTCEFYFDKYENGRRKFHVEIQWLAHHPVFELYKRLSNKTLFQKNSTVHIDKTEVTVLNEDQHFITMLLHHGLRENWNSLKYLLDLAMILKHGQLDMEFVAAVTKEYKFKKVLTSGLQLSNDLLGVGSGVPLAPKMNTTRFINVLLSGNSKRRTFLQKQLDILDHTDDIAGKAKLGWKVVKHSFEPSVEDYRYCKLPRGWHFLYFFVKATRVSSEKFKRNNRFAG